MILTYVEAVISSKVPGTKLTVNLCLLFNPTGYGLDTVTLENYNV
jgi:hypothetical protein